MTLLVRGLLALLIVVAMLWDRSLLAERERARDTSQRIGRLVSADEREDLAVAAVSVRDGRGNSWLYGRLAGLWRCLDHHQAPADAGAIGRLVDELLRAEGVVQSDDADRAGGYGFDGDSMWQVRFHGADVMSAPDRDVLFAVDLGAEVPGLDGGYVRRTGSHAIWAVDTTPRRLLDAPRPPGSPPLLDPHVVAAGFPAQGHRLQRIVVDRADGAGFALHVREVEVPEQDLMRGASPFRWMLQDAEGESEPNPMLVVSYVNFLKLAPWVSVLDRGQAEAEGLATPQGRLTLEDSQGRVAVLVVGPTREGFAAVANGHTNTLLSVAGDVAGLLLPVEAQLTDSPTNPWQPWLEASASGPQRLR